MTSSWKSLTEKQKIHMAKIMAACEERMRECRIFDMETGSWVVPGEQGEVKGGKSDFGAKMGLVMPAFAPYLSTESVWIKMWLLHGTDQPEPYKY